MYEKSLYTCFLCAADVEHIEAGADLDADAHVPGEPPELGGGAALRMALPGPLQHHPYPHHALHGRVVHARRTSRPGTALTDPRRRTGPQGISDVTERCV